MGLRFINTEHILENIYPHRKVTVAAARELSWRKFYGDAGGKEKVKEFEGKAKLGKLLMACEKCFTDLLENKLSEEKIKALIALPSTDTWKVDHKDKSIRLRRTKEVACRGSSGL